MHFVLKCTIDPDFADREFERPITDELFSNVENEIVTLLDKTRNDFAIHLENDAADYSFEALISDAFDLLAQYALQNFSVATQRWHYKNRSDV